MKHKKHDKNVFPASGVKTVTPSGKKPFNWKLLLTLVVNTAVVFSIYRVAMNYSWFKIVLGIYLFAAAGLAIGYTLYNRGFSRRGVTADMLPDTMSAEQKCEFIADGERRMKKSKWMLTLLIPLLLTFTYDLLELFVFSYFESLFS